MSKEEKEHLDDLGAAGAVIGTAIAVLFGIFIFLASFSSKNETLRPGCELRDVGRFKIPYCDNMPATHEQAYERVRVKK
ncbi:hypothetical protein K2Q08_03585 [Patescibacteria group bacterium]|nr:hypothetical protein [Patescibacteria group bacterium]